MTNSSTEAASCDNSITLFRSLIADLQFNRLSDNQLYDLSGIAEESAEGLCRGLFYLGESLEQNSTQLSPENLGQISALLKATAHLIPAMFEVYERANGHLLMVD